MRMKLKKTLIFITFLLIYSIMFSMVEGPGGESGAWMYFRAFTTVKDVNNQLLEGIKIRMVASYGLLETDFESGMTEWRVYTFTKIGYTDANGNVLLDGYVNVTEYYPGNYKFYDLKVLMESPPNYAIISHSGDYSQLSHTSAYFTIGKDKDGNGVYDGWETDLAEKFKPILIFHDSNYLIPIDVEEIYPDISSIENAFADSSFAPLPISKHGPTYWKYYWLTHFEPKLNQSGYYPTVYFYIFKKEFRDYYTLKPNNYYILQYWFYYPFNDALDIHEGDWEHIDVILTNINPDQTQAFGVIYYYHHSSTPLKWDYVEKEMSRPLVYVGGRQILEVLHGNSYTLPGHEITGGSYFRAGRHYNVASPRDIWEGKIGEINTWKVDEIIEIGRRIENFQLKKLTNNLWWFDNQLKIYWGYKIDTNITTYIDDKVEVKKLGIPIKTLPIVQWPPMGPPNHEKFGNITYPGKEYIFVVPIITRSYKIGIKYSLFAKSEVEITIKNNLNQTVNHYYLGIKDFGEHIFTWDLKNMRGEVISNGPYFFKIKVSPENLLSAFWYFKEE